MWWNEFALTGMFGGGAALIRLIFWLPSMLPRRHKRRTLK